MDLTDSLVGADPKLELETPLLKLQRRFCLSLWIYKARVQMSVRFTPRRDKRTKVFAIAHDGNSAQPIALNAVAVIAADPHVELRPDLALFRGILTLSRGHFD